MKKKNVLLLKFVFFAIFISCTGGNQDVNTNSDIKQVNDIDSIIFKGTPVQLDMKESIVKDIKDVSTCINIPLDSLIKLNDFQVKYWMDAFPNIGGHGFYLVSVCERSDIYTLYILANGEGGDRVYLINVSQDGSFIDALNVFNNHRSGPKEDDKRGVVIHFEFKNSIIDKNRIEVIRTQNLTSSWESSEMYEEKVIEYFFISSEGKINKEEN